VLLEVPSWPGVWAVDSNVWLPLLLKAGGHGLRLENSLDFVEFILKRFFCHLLRVGLPAYLRIWLNAGGALGQRRGAVGCAIKDRVSRVASTTIGSVKCFGLLLLVVRTSEVPTMDDLLRVIVSKVRVVCWPCWWVDV